MKPKVVIEVSDGVVTNVYSDTSMDVVVFDWDERGLNPDSEERFFCDIEGMDLQRIIDGGEES